MKKSIYLFLLLSFYAQAQPSARNEALHRLFEEYYEDYLRLHPQVATRQGDNRYDDKLPYNVLLLHERTDASLNEVYRFYASYRNRLKKFNSQTLNPEDRISYYILSDMVERSLTSQGLQLNQLPVNQMLTVPLTMAQLGSGRNSHPFKTVKDYENWLKRVEAFAQWTESAIGQMQKGLKTGIVLPRVIVERVIPQMENLATLNEVQKSVFWGPIHNMPDHFQEEERKILTAAYEKAIKTQLVPSYRKLANFLRQEYLPKARSTTGLYALPNGDKIYRYFINLYTTTRLTPEDIHQLGLREVARITTELEALKAEMGFEGSLKELFRAIEQDPKYHPYNTKEEVLDAYRGIQAKVEPHLPALFGVSPKAPFEIRETEAFRAASASAEYFGALPDGSRPGIFYIPILDATKMGLAEERLFLHEALPGHHFQVSLQHENTKLPRFQRHGWFGAFLEGWGLYTESLGELLGCYTDPYQKLIARGGGGEMHRAIRLVVDTGIHTGRMTREEAIDYMMDHEVISEREAILEIDRYIARPGQALSYKIGELKIKELRDKYQRQLGDRFSLRSFHDAILLGGAMPLTVLETYLDQWAAEQ